MRSIRFAHLLILLTPLLVHAAPAGAADARPSLFDPARHMRVSEVKPGMKGYGLSVFKGTKIERFEVEILSVLVNFNPRHDVILVRCSGANLEHTGSIQGMSGSPIYLDDGTGNHRMIGAFAYGWPMMKDPVGGVQPIEYMLELREPAEPAPEGQKEDAGRADAGLGGQRWNVLDALALPHLNGKPTPKDHPFASWRSAKPNPQLGSETFADTSRLRPLATPMMTSGLSPKLIDQMRPIFESYGIVPVQAGGFGGSGSGARHDDDAPFADIEPGSALVVPLITGDIDMSAVGTATEVIGDYVFGFGHQFMSEGPVSLPMGAGRIDGVIANLVTSFKLGTITRPRGTIFVDQMVGVAGRFGEVAPMVPLSLRVVYADGSQDQQYTFKMASHPRFTPLLAVMALSGAVEGEHELPQFHTLDYDLVTEFANGKSMRLKNTAVNSNAGLFFEVGAPMMLAADNPFERVLVKSVTGTITVTPEAREATILSVHVPRLKYRPGETVRAYVTYRPFREVERLLPIDFELPRDVADGTYQLVVSDWTQFLADETAAKPFRFTAESVDEVFEVMNELNAYRHDAVYVRMVREGDGVAIGRTAMPNLSSSRREVLIGAGRSNTTPFVSSTTKTIPVEYVMSGSAQFEITVDKNARVEVGGKPGAKQEPATPATPRKSEDKPTPAPRPDAPRQDVPAPSETP